MRLMPIPFLMLLSSVALAFPVEVLFPNAMSTDPYASPGSHYKRVVGDWNANGPESAAIEVPDREPFQVQGESVRLTNERYASRNSFFLVQKKYFKAPARINPYLKPEVTLPGTLSPSVVIPIVRWERESSYSPREEIKEEVLVSDTFDLTPYHGQLTDVWIKEDSRKYIMAVTLGGTLDGEVLIAAKARLSGFLSEHLFEEKLKIERFSLSDLVFDFNTELFFSRRDGSINRLKLPDNHLPVFKTLFATEGDSRSKRRTDLAQAVALEKGRWALPEVTPPVKPKWQQALEWVRGYCGLTRAFDAK
jgi:hypothetical protein